MTEKHVESVQLKDVVITPSHDPRKETAEFARNRNVLKKDGHAQCWICGSTNNLEVHHLTEWSLAHIIDMDKLKAFLLTFDIYGYSKKKEHEPLTSIDDIRNLMVLCKNHHTGFNQTAQNATGIHNLIFPFWITQKIAKDGMNPVPQHGETIEEVDKRVG